MTLHVNIWPIESSIGSDAWNSDDFHLSKAYLLSIFSELVYLKIEDSELKAVDRAMLVPCFMFREAVSIGVSFDINGALRRRDIPPQFIVSTGRSLALGIVVRENLIVTIRGTVGLFDWYVNSAVVQETFVVDKVKIGLHAGFFDEAMALSKLLLPEINKAVNQRTISNIYFTGHSLGGALAVLSQTILRGVKFAKIGEVQCVDFGLNNSSVSFRVPYVFGMPKFGNRDAIHVIGWPKSVVHKKDPVPNLPLLFASGLHDVTMDRENQEHFSSRISRFGVVKTLSRIALSRLNIAGNHDMSNYVARLGVRELGILK